MEQLEGCSTEGGVTGGKSCTACLSRFKKLQEHSTTAVVAMQMKSFLLILTRVLPISEAFLHVFQGYFPVFQGIFFLNRCCLTSIPSFLIFT